VGSPLSAAVRPDDSLLVVPGRLLMVQGQDGEEVKPRLLPKSVSCGKTFRGKNALTGLTAVHSWLQQLGHELEERLEADRSADSSPPGSTGYCRGVARGVHGVFFVQR